MLNVASSEEITKKAHDEILRWLSDRSYLFAMNQSEVEDYERVNILSQYTVHMYLGTDRA